MFILKQYVIARINQTIEPVSVLIPIDAKIIELTVQDEAIPNAEQGTVTVGKVTATALVRTSASFARPYRWDFKFVDINEEIKESDKYVGTITYRDQKFWVFS